MPLRWPLASNCQSTDMKRAAQSRVVLVTAPDLRVARRLARTALQARLAACANLIPGLESHYWWRGKIETAREVLLLFKTRANRLRALERLIVAEHPYDTPEFVALPLAAGAERYLAWIASEVSVDSHSRGRKSRRPGGLPRKGRVPIQKSC